MKVTVKLCRNVLVEAEAEDLQTLYVQLAALEEIFSIRRCGLCGAEDIRHVLRENAGHRFFEVHCEAAGCHGRLALGIPKQGKGLFPRRKDDKGQPLANGGWSRYTPPVS